MAAPNTWAAPPSESESEKRSVGAEGPGDLRAEEEGGMGAEATGAKRGA